jgi:divalent metal cation (Fe/Co/Zn/Cd) transporter
MKNGNIQSFHDLKTRQWWSHSKFVEYHFVLPPKTTIKTAHDIWDKINGKIKSIDKNCDWSIMWHIDYKDDSLKK